MLLLMLCHHDLHHHPGHTAGNAPSSQYSVLGRVLWAGWAGSHRQFLKWFSSVIDVGPEDRIPVHNPWELFFPVSALTLLVGRQEGHPACKKLDVDLLVVMI